MRSWSWLCVAILLWAWATRATADGGADLVVQTSLAAGLAHHDAKAVWDELKPGDQVALIREAGNPYDPHAVRLDWHGRTLGYLPRSENQAVARQLDHGNALEARIVGIGVHRNHRRRLEVEIYLRM
jgi:hypothetical protein